MSPFCICFGAKTKDNDDVIAPVKLGRTKTIDERGSAAQPAAVMVITETPKNKVLTQAFLDATITRRSTIALQKTSPIPDAKIEELVKHAILYAPTAFDVQATRAVIFFGPHHDKLWDMVHAHAQNQFPAEMFDSFIAPNLKSNKASYGTVSTLQLGRHTYLR